MVEAMLADFDHIYSIELSEELYRKAKEKFKGARHLELIHGDSGIEIKNVLRRINQPTLFWLDGHYSGGITAKGDKTTPIYDELANIFNAPDMGHVILVDDARCFGTDPAYPSLTELNKFIKSKRSNVRVSVEHDIVRIIPNY
jgi:hypothetical protein